MTSHAHKVATLQSQKSRTLKHALGYHLFYTKYDQNLQNKQQAVLKKIWNKWLRP